MDKLMLYFNEAHVLAEKEVIKDPMGKTCTMSCPRASLSSCPHLYSSFIFRQIQTLATWHPRDR